MKIKYQYKTIKKKLATAPSNRTEIIKKNKPPF